MKKIKKENQYAGGKRNIEDDRRSRLNHRRADIKERELNRNGSAPNDYEDSDRSENDNYRLRANRPGFRDGGIQINQSKTQQYNNRNKKMDSVKTEMEIRAWGNYIRGKANNRNGEKDNEE